MSKKTILLILLAVIFILLLPLTSLYSQNLNYIAIKNIELAEFPELEISFSLYDSQGIFINNISPSSIIIKENGKQVSDFKLTSQVNTEEPIFITLLIDNSGSMKGNPLTEAKNASVKFIKSLNIADEIKIYAFNDAPAVLTDFTNNKNTLIELINSIEVAGTKTAMNLAVYNAARDLASKPEGQRFIVLLTDGVDEDVSIAQDDAINLSKELKIPIHSIGFGNTFIKKSGKYEEEAKQALTRFSILTGGVFYIASEANMLEKNLTSISDLLKKHYIVKYRSGLPKDGESHEIELCVKISSENLTEKRTIKTPTYNLKVEINNIDIDQNLDSDIEIVPSIEIIGPFEVKEEVKIVKYFLDNSDQPLYETNKYPYIFDLKRSDLSPGEHKIIMKLNDSLDREHTATKIFNIVSEEIKPFKWWPIIIALCSATIIAIIIVLIFVFKNKKRQKTDTLQKKKVNLSETIVSRDFKQAPSALLLVNKGLNKGYEYILPLKNNPLKRQISVGRLPDNDIVVSCPSVSRYHFSILIEKSSYYIEDLKSANGTVLNGSSITHKILLKDNDVITVGDTEIRFTYLKPDETLSLGIIRNK